MSVGAWTKLSSPAARRVTHESAENICQDGRTKLSSLAFSNPMPIRVRARTKIFSGERIFRGGIETRGSAGGTQFVFACAAAEITGTSIATQRTTDVPNVCSPTLRLPSPAPEILDYLARQPDAQDTIDGILHWWVLDACIRKWAPKIAETVAQLVEQGFLEEKPSADGNVFYHVSPHYLATLQQRPPRNSTPNATP